MAFRPARLAAFATAFLLVGSSWPGRAGAHEPWPRAGRAGRDEAICKSVAHIGDSLTAYTQGSLERAYGALGVDAQIDAHGGRATLQKLRSDPKTGRQAALDLRNSGFEGCWVVALGTNDTANVAAGASYTRAKAIDEMMTAIDPTATAPVLWVNAFTMRRSGHWSNANMRRWNEALEAARARWKNLRVFDWASVAANGAAPFSDGIHHTAEGYAVRNRAISQALADLRPPDPPN